MITEFGGIVQLVKNTWLTSSRSVVRIHLPLQNALVAQSVRATDFKSVMSTDSIISAYKIFTHLALEI